MTSKLEPVTPAELCWQEADGAVSINAQAVAERLNALLEAIQRLQRPSSDVLEDYAIYRCPGGDWGVTVGGLISDGYVTRESAMEAVIQFLLSVIRDLQDEREAAP